MSYDLYIDNKNVGQIASNSGWRSAATWLEEHGGEELKKLATTGVSTNSENLRNEIDDFISVPKNISDILQEISEKAEGAETVGVSQEGAVELTEDDEDPDDDLDIDDHQELKEQTGLKRPIKPHEKKHDFNGHVQRQDSTTTAIRRIIAGVKTTLITDAARRAANLEPQHLESLTVPFNKGLANRIARSVSIAHKYGHDQVYAERYRATKRSKKEKPKLLLTSNRILHDQFKWNGLTVSVENAAGSVRKGVGGDGVPWTTKMQYPYGYINRTTGADNEHIDCYIGPKADAEEVYIVHQNDPDTGEYDEDKVMLGFYSKAAAKKAYMDHHSRSRQTFGSMTVMTLPEFKKALEDGKGKLHLKTKFSTQELSEKSAKQDQPRLIAETTLSDINNRISSRVKSSHIDNYKKGLRDDDLEKSILDDLRYDTDGWMDRIAAEAARSAVAGGRYQALEELAGEIRSYARSEAMDINTCDPCEEGDGDEWDSLDEVDWSPGDDCEGKDACRGQLMPIFDDEGTVETEDEEE